MSDISIFILCCAYEIDSTQYSINSIYSSYAEALQLKDEFSKTYPSLYFFIKAFSSYTYSNGNLTYSEFLV